jgi:hypothetical protein
VRRPTPGTSPATLAADHSTARQNCPGHRGRLDAGWAPRELAAFTGSNPGGCRTRADRTALAAGKRCHRWADRDPPPNGIGTFTFARTTYTARRRRVCTAIDVIIVAGSVQLSKDGEPPLDATCR